MRTNAYEADMSAADEAHSDLARLSVVRELTYALLHRSMAIVTIENMIVPQGYACSYLKGYRLNRECSSLKGRSPLHEPFASAYQEKRLN